MNSTDKGVSLACTCCYCGQHQAVEQPPALVECIRCRRPFRIFINYGQKTHVELTLEAKEFYSQSPTRMA